MVIDIEAFRYLEGKTIKSAKRMDNDELVLDFTDEQSVSIVVGNVTAQQDDFEPILLLHRE